MPDRESIFICTVDNKPGVIEKVTDVFADLKININSVCAAPIHQMGKSSIVIVAEKSTVQPAKIEEILRSRMDYILVKDAERGDIYERELALVCVKCEIGHTAHIMQTAEMFNADVLGIGKESMTFEMVGLPDKVDAFIKALEEYGIIRLTRSGRAVMEKEEVS